jgi:Fic family protein
MLNGSRKYSFSAPYRRYTPAMTDAMFRIAKSLGAIEAAPVLPAVADQLRSSARVGTVHYSNLIEGNELSVVAAERAARGELEPDTRAKVELVNYVEALDLIDALLDGDDLELSSDFLKRLHATTTRSLGREEDDHFKPHHEGEWRDGTAVVVDHLTNRIMHEGPPPEEVAPRMDSMFDWLGEKLESGSDSPFVLAGVMHYGITDIHPFADGNGRVARLFQVAVLMQAGLLPGRMFSFERFYAEDRGAYYAALRSVREQTLNMEAWLHYFLGGLAEEYERVAAAVEDLSTLTLGGGSTSLRLSASQERGLTDLRIQGRREFTRRDYEAAAGVGRSAAIDDIGELVAHGILLPRGSGAATRYLFTERPSREPTRHAGRRGRPVKWTDGKIERELRAFVAGRPSWPSPEEFRSEGMGPLYAAASKRGGIGRWRRIVGR